MPPHTPDADAPSAAQLTRLVDAIDLPIARWDLLHRLSFCNEPFARWAGQPVETMLGRTLAEIFGDADWAVARAAFAQGYAGRPRSYELLVTHHGSPARWSRVKVFPEAAGAGPVQAVYTLAFDIHNDVVQRDALEAARRRLDRFVDNIPYPLTYVDRDLVLRFANKAYVGNAGQPAEQLVGEHIGEARGTRRWNEHRPYYERALAGEAGQYTRLVEVADHGPRWLRTSYVPDLDLAGRVVGLYTVTVDVHEITVAQEKLRRSLERDALTDVLSRRAVIDRIDALLLGAHETPVALFFVDLDGFKAVNDTCGHREGDRVLALIGSALQAAMRADDAVGRFGGDEFIVLAQVRDVAAAAALAQHLLDAVQRCSTDAAGTPPVSASIGFALAPNDAATALRLVQRADDAMYVAKRQGGSRAVYCGDAQVDPR